MLPTGTSLGPYAIQGLLGAGGMGEVYRASDVRLDRDVAIKVLPSHVVADTSARDRFQREARALAAITHPHICRLYDVGRSGGHDYLVMELLAGETLAATLASGPLPMARVLELAIQIADALKCAHRAGITHRDLKPANVIVTKTGAKLLDFGLAKTHGPLEPASDGAAAEAATAEPLTGLGVVLGTTAYMAPEQAEGGAVDHRTDIFAFGTLMYEMVSGRSPFTGRSHASVIAAILTTEPAALTTLHPQCPAALDHIVRRCLSKDPDERWQSAHDVGAELRHVIASGAAPDSESSAARGRGRAIAAWAVVVVGAAIAAAVAGGWPSRPGAPAPVHRLTVPVATGVRFTESRPSLAISRDGRNVAFVASGSGGDMLFVRPVDRFEAVPLQGTLGASGPFFSPDGEWLGFVQNGKLMRLALRGGVPLPVIDAPDMRGAVWDTNDTIVYTPRLDAGLWRIPVDGGTPLALTAPDAIGGEKTHRFPDLLPDGRGVLFTIGTSDIASFADAHIAVKPGDGPIKTIIRGGVAAKYLATGHIIYARDGALLIAPFDLQRLEVTGPPTTVAEGVAHGMDFGRVEYAVSGTGTLIFLHGGDTSRRGLLTSVDRQGTHAPISTAPRPFASLSFSPDGQHILSHLLGANDSIWLFDVRRDALNRLLTRGNLFFTSWSADGTRVLYSSTNDLGWIAADGSGQEEILHRAPFPMTYVHAAPDGDTVYFESVRPDSGIDIYTLSLKAREVTPWVATRFNEGRPKASPDGQWVAFVSNETGRDEVYVRPARGPGPRMMVSRSGGTTPVWARTGRELFFVQDRSLMSVAVHASARGLTVDRPEPLFELKGLNPAAQADSFDASPDGRSFVVSAPLDIPLLTQLHVVSGWFSELTSPASSGR